MIKKGKNNTNINIIKYDDKYLESIKDLLSQEEYRFENIDLDKVKNNSYKCFLAIENEKIVGLIIGNIRRYDEYDFLDYSCPKSGIVTEIFVSHNTGSNEVKRLLLETLEDYFISIDCKYVLIDVFNCNENTIEYYNKKEILDLVV